MSNVLRLAIVDPSDNSRTQLKNMLLGMDIVWLEAECSRYEFFADVIGQTKPDIGVVAIDSNPEEGPQAARAGPRDRPRLLPCSSSAARPTAR